MNEYKVIRKLGQGAFSRVFLVYSKANPSTHRCIKVIPLVSSTDYDRARRELDILRSLPKHSSIIYTYSAFMDEERANVFLVLEYAEHGDLNAYLKQRREQVDKGEATWIPEGQVWGWFLALVDGVSHLHQHKVLHRDIKTKNILITKENKLKLADFGVARPMDDQLALTCVGTPLYLSPELCRGEPYSYPSDIWALGCVIYHICALVHPFASESFQELVKNVLARSIRALPSHYSSELRDTIFEMVSLAPTKRPSAQLLFEKVGKIRTLPIRNARSGSLSYVSTTAKPTMTKAFQLRKLKSEMILRSTPNNPAAVLFPGYGKEDDRHHDDSPPSLPGPTPPVHLRKVQSNVHVRFTPLKTDVDPVPVTSRSVTPIPNLKPLPIPTPSITTPAMMITEEHTDQIEQTEEVTPFEAFENVRLRLEQQWGAHTFRQHYKAARAGGSSCPQEIRELGNTYVFFSIRKGC